MTPARLPHGPSAPPDSHLADGQAAPWRHGFLPLLRRLGARHAAGPRIGAALHPEQEPFRLGQQASMLFAPREIAQIAQRQGRPLIRLFGLGMLGPNGPLPIHMTETVRERSESRRDHTLADFLDIFHHRYLTLLYRAWAQSQAAAGLDRAADETFTRYIAHLSGDAADEVPPGPLPPHARWASAAHRVRLARNPDGLAASLAHYFGVGVRLHEFQLHWITIEPDDTSRMGVPRASGLLGQGAVAGEAVPDRQHKFRLTLGPLGLRQYLRLTPQGGADGSDVPTLREWVRAFTGFEYVWEVELVLHRDEAPPCSLGDAARLGWSSWMGQAAGGTVVTGMVYEPEHYTLDTA